MGTRSVIAVPQGDSWRGRYCHWDGYPSHMLVDLPALVNRLGYEAAIKFLTEEHSSWSSLGDHPNACEGTTNEDEGWITPEGDDWGTEWAYVLYPTRISVLSRMTSSGAKAVGMFGFNQGADASLWLPVGTLRYDEPVTDERLTVIECGEKYERCIHYARCHFPEAPDHVSTNTWLGRGSLRFSDACAVEVGGLRYRLTGSGWQGSARSSRDYSGNIKVHYWWATAQREGSDNRTELRIARCVKDGYKVEHPLFVPTRGGERVIEPGAVVAY